MSNDIKVGIRIESDARDARAELDRMRQAFVSLGRDSRRELADSTRRSVNLRRELSGVTSAVRSLRNAFGALAAGVTLASLHRQISEISSITLQFNTVLGRSGEAMRFASRIADRYGLELNAVAGGYAKLSAAAMGTALSQMQVQRIFEGVSRAVGALDLSAVEAEGALLAISQMMSKGVVSAEELRGQLGERLPGAFQIAARAMGVTTAELDKMLSQGAIAAGEFLPGFAAELERTFGRARFDSYNAAVNRLGNAWSRFLAEMTDTGAFAAAVENLQWWAEVLGDAVKILRDGPDAVLGFRIALLELDQAALELQARFQDLKTTLLEIARLDATFSLERLLPGGSEYLAALEEAVAGSEREAENLRRRIVEIGDQIDLLQRQNFFKEFADDLKAAGRSAQEIKSALRQAFGGLPEFQQLKKGLETYVDLISKGEAETRRLGRTLKSTTDNSLAEFKKQLSSLADAFIRNIQNTQALTDEALRLAGVLRADEWDEYLAVTDELARLYEQGAINVRQLVTAVDRLNRKFGEGVVDESRKAMREFNDELDTAKTKTGELSGLMERTADRIQNAFSDAFYRVFDDGLGSFNDLADSILDAFKRMLAEMLAMAMARPIIVPMVAGVGGALGVGQGSLQSLLGQFGGIALSGGGGDIGQGLYGQAAGVGVSATAGGQATGGLSNVSQGVVGAVPAIAGLAAGYAIDYLLSEELGAHPSISTTASVVGGIAAGGAAAGALGGAGIATLGTTGAAGAAAGTAGAGALAGAGTALSAIPVAGWIALAALALWKGGFFKEANLETYGTKWLFDITDSTSDMLGLTDLYGVSPSEIADEPLNYPLESTILAAMAVPELLLYGFGLRKILGMTTPKDPRFFLRLMGGQYGIGESFEDPGANKPNLFTAPGGYIVTELGGSMERGAFVETALGQLGGFFGRGDGRGLYNRDTANKIKQLIEPVGQFIDIFASLFDNAEIEALQQRVGVLTVKETSKNGSFDLEKALGAFIERLSEVGAQVSKSGEMFRNLFRSLRDGGADLADAAQGALLLTSAVKNMNAPQAVIDNLTLLSTSIEDMSKALNAFAQANQLMPNVIGVFGDVQDILRRFRQEGETLAQVFLRGVENVKLLEAAFGKLNLGIRDTAEFSLSIDRNLLQAFSNEFGTIQSVVQEQIINQYQRLLTPFFGQFDLRAVLSGMPATEFRDTVAGILNSGRFTGQALTAVAEILMALGLDAKRVGLLIDESANKIGTAGESIQSRLNALGDALLDIGDLADRVGASVRASLADALINLATDSQRASIVLQQFNQKLSELLGGNVDLARVFQRLGVRSIEDFSKAAQDFLRDTYQQLQKDGLTQNEESFFVDLAKTLSDLKNALIRSGYFNAQAPSPDRLDQTNVSINWAGIADSLDVVA